MSDNARIYHKKYDTNMNSIKHVKTGPTTQNATEKQKQQSKKIKHFLNKFEVQNIEYANQLLKKFQKQYNDMPHSNLKYLSSN